MPPSIGPFLNGRQLCLSATQSESSSRRFAVYFSIGRKSMQGDANGCNDVGVGPRGCGVGTIQNSNVGFTEERKYLSHARVSE